MVRGGRETYALFKLERERIECNSLASTLNSDGTEVFSRDEIEHGHMLFCARHLLGPYFLQVACECLCDVGSLSQ